MWYPLKISTHAPLAGRDGSLVYRLQVARIFQPTRPLRGATTRIDGLPFASIISTHAPLAGRDSAKAVEPKTDTANFNPRAPCGARPHVLHHHYNMECISTHAPLAGRDLNQVTRPKPKPISTHAPLAGRDSQQAKVGDKPKYFNPRAPCGARHSRAMSARGAELISTHAPLAGRDDRQRAS